jgi:hypothetical protein
LFVSRSHLALVPRGSPRLDWVPRSRRQPPGPVRPVTLRRHCGGFAFVKIASIN